MIIKNGTPFLDVKKMSSTQNFPDLFTQTIKSHGDIYFWEKGNFHVITRAEDAKNVLMSESFSANRAPFFISRMPNLDLSLISDFFSVVKKMMVMSDDEDHIKRRRAAALGMEEHILQRYTQKVRETIRELLREVEGKEEFDFATTVAKKLPSIVLADLFQVSPADREDFFRYSNIMTGFFGGGSQYRNEDGIEVNLAARKLREYFIQMIQERRSSRGDDYVSMVIKSSAELDLEEDEIISQLIMMLVAGQVTTTDQINNVMYILAQRPLLQEELRRSPELIPQALEELKRLDPAVTFIFRVCRRETQIGVQPIKEGDVIFISTHAINRDLPESSSPHEVNIHRKASHFAYGHGPHYCLGAKLGRMEMRHLFEEILQVWPKFGLGKQEAVRDHYSLSFSGFKSLPLSVS